MSTLADDAAPRTLADQFRNWPDERIVALLRARIDLTAPSPQDSAQLAARAAARSSVARVLEGLDRFHLLVAEAAVHLPTAAAIRESTYADPAAVDAALERLFDLAVLWGSPEEPRPVSVLGELLGTVPLAGPPRLDGTSPQARALLDHLDAVDADGRADSITPPIRELLDRNLVVRRDDGRHIAVPFPVRVLLRGGRSTRVPVDAPPPLATSDRDATSVDRAAAGAAFEFVRRTELLLDTWGSRPPAVLASGGLGVRDLRLAADLLGLEPRATGLVIEVAYAAGLLGDGSTDEVERAWLPTHDFDGWWALPTAGRWAVLARAWLDGSRRVALIGGRDEAGRPINALTADLAAPGLADVKRAIFDAAGPPLAAGTGLASLVERLHWFSPRRPAPAHVVDELVTEAAEIGLFGLGGLSTPAQAMRDGADPAPALAALLPPPVDHVLIQADLTAIAPGPLTPDLARRLGELADIESHGGATVYRFSADSVRRGFDAGWAAEEMREFLAEVSRTPVPQALDYLVGDVARRFGTLRVGAAESFVRTDDEAALTAIVSDSSLRLRRIAPTVAVSDLPMHLLLPRLRESGAAPAVEAPDGTVRVARPDVYRARNRRTRTPELSPAQVDVRRAAHAASAVTHIRAGDRLAASRPAGQAAASPGDVLALLQGAAESGARVRIAYMDSRGTLVERLVQPNVVEGGSLHADGERFPIHRIARAAVVV